MMAGQRLRRTEDHQLVLKDIRALESTCDVILVADGHKFAAHRGMLATASPVFRKLFTAGMEKQLPEISACIWKVVLDFIYFEEIELYGAQQGIELLKSAI